MKIKYDEIEIEIDTMPLQQYAMSVMGKMQEADKEFADCWTGCAINFEDLQPEFHFGAIEDMKSFKGLLVECPSLKRSGKHGC